MGNESEHGFPARTRSPLGGQPPIDHRVVLTAILFVLRTGIAWADLPLELGCSSKTCLRRLHEWTTAGVWTRVFRHLLTRLRTAGRRELADMLVNAALVKASPDGQHGFAEVPFGESDCRRRVPARWKQLPATE